MARKGSATDRSKDRHKPRRTISFTPQVYEAIARLADRNHRPIGWEAERIILEALEAEGLWPPAEGEGDKG
jgi:hypothetical protein